ncbi:MAG: MFS transporter [Deltaproteobacteria bacterium]|nr:MFS transporter [Nannocystaceae bacterium]
MREGLTLEATSTALPDPSVLGAPAPAANTRWFAPILAVQFIGTLGYSIAIPFLVFLVTDFGGAAWTFGFVGATYSVCQLIGAPILGRISDRLGRRPVLLASQGGTMLAWLLFLVAFALPLRPLATIAGATITVPLLVVFAARAFDGLTGGNISVASAYVADRTEGNPTLRRVAFGRMAMAASLGFAIGPAIAGLLGATRWGYVAPVAAAAVISGIATVLCLRLDEPRSRCAQGPPPQPTVTRVLGQQQLRCDRPAEPVPTAALRRPLVVALLVATFVLFLSFNFFYVGFPVHAQQVLGWDAGAMGGFFAIMSGAMIVAQGPLLKAATRAWSPAVVFAVGTAALCASFLAFSVPSTPVVFAGALLFAVGNGLSWPTFQSRLADVAGPEAQGAVQGMATSVGAAASIVGLVVGGIFYPVVGVGIFAVGALGFAGLVLGTRRWFRVDA